MTDPNALKVAKLERDVLQLTDIVKILGKKIEFLERENSRRKNEITQIIAAIKKG